VLLLWFATSHTATYRNLNFLWAFAPNLVVAFVLLKNKIPHWVKGYNKILLLLIALTFILWILKIQVFNLAITPFLLVLIIRYYYLMTFRKKIKN